MIKAIIFDWHGVLEKRDFRDTVFLISQKGGIAKDKILKEIRNDRISYDLDKISPDDFWAKIGRDYNLSKDDATFIRNQRLKIEKDEKLWEVLPGLSKQYKLAILSDCSIDKVQLIRKNVDLTLFEQVFFSSEMGITKDNPGYFRLLLKKLNITAKEGLFVDDLEENIKVAQRVGLLTLHYKDQADFLERITSQKQISAKKVVLVSFLVDVSDLLLNLLVAVLSGSVVMLTQALQGGSDLIASGLLLVGVKRAGRPADLDHPFGHGRELYFWTLLASLVMFGITAVFSFYFGWQRFMDPKPIQNIIFAYGMLIFGVVTNLYAFSLSYRRLLGKRNLGKIWRVFWESTLVETKTTFTLDLMGTLAGALGLVALVVYGLTGDLRFDGIGAMVIGVALGVLSLSLLITAFKKTLDFQSGDELNTDMSSSFRGNRGLKSAEDVINVKDLIIGKSASPEDENS